jgi:hypothetical protein
VKNVDKTSQNFILRIWGLLYYVWFSFFPYWFLTEYGN